MKFLSLLRHAKSDWSAPQEGGQMVRDYDRPLNRKGEQAACAMGDWIAKEKIIFDYVLASPATRVQQTINFFENGYGRALNPHWDKRIYLASSVTLIDLISQIDDAPVHVLMVGHNPGLEDIILDLVKQNSQSPLRDEVEQKYPTASFATIKLDIDNWADIENGNAQLTQFMRPRDVDAKFGPEYD
ncbi:histidine phosphatase family protein [Sphingorhabdus lutea]|uniref:Histidine phosphatase family protein n=1 Tax=Sphingorhabdus lutea TaxID=1913578 RepID=A0A1L3JAK2_9SPHN|nr:histidine phosphatase family protein [Sphingorhabdus lutea]APG62157.1 histidine phosphatase family protein [Sphingorhabdus lutea]